MQRFLHVGRSSSTNVVNSLQSDAVILFFGTTACSSLIAAATSVLLGVFVFDFHWFAVLESFGEIWVKHDATRSGLVIAQCLGHGIENRGLRFRYQGIAHCRSIYDSNMFC